MNPINQVLEFVIRHYPVSVYPKVLEIAAGSGRLSRLLAHKGYQVTAMDPELVIDRYAPYEQDLNPFDESTNISEYDLGIAVHPCDIHEIIIRQFQNSGKGLFLIPCVTYACHSASVSQFDNNDEWLQYLGQYGLNQTELFDETAPHYIQPFSHAFYRFGDQVPVRITPYCKKK